MRVVGLFWILGWLLVAAQIVLGRHDDVNALLFWATGLAFAVAVIWGLVKGPATVRWAVCLWVLSLAIAFYGILSFYPYLPLAIAGALQVASIGVGIYAYLNESRATA